MEGFGATFEWLVAKQAAHVCSGSATLNPYSTVDHIYIFQLLGSTSASFDVVDATSFEATQIVGAPRSPTSTIEGAQIDGHREVLPLLLRGHKLMGTAKSYLYF